LGVIFLIALYIIVGSYSFIYLNLIFQFTRPILVLFCALLFILIASAVERAVFLAETQKARKLAERELEIGREIQAGFFPNTLPVPEGWELVAYFQAARHVGGDFYDAFSIGEKKDIGLVVADVCDKGVGAALFMALFRSLIRVLSGSAGNNNHLVNRFSHHDPAKTLEHTILSVNNYISTTHEAESMFSTIFFGILNPESGVLHYINGGHEPPMIIGARGIRATLCPTGPAVGVYPNAGFEVRSIQLEPEDVLLAYTDGVVDAQNQAGDSFTKIRLSELLTESYPSAKALIDNITIQIKDHNIGQEQFDDITILALRRTASSD
jgi:serine phosphatase RsbU (regulator of sigma subunit)